jgi:hypothetical protein
MKQNNDKIGITKLMIEKTLYLSSKKVSVMFKVSVSTINRLRKMFGLRKHKNPDQETQKNGMIWKNYTKEYFLKKFTNLNPKPIKSSEDELNKNDVLIKELGEFKTIKKSSIDVIDVMEKSYLLDDDKRQNKASNINDGEFNEITEFENWVKKHSPFF